MKTIPKQVTIQSRSEKLLVIERMKERWRCFRRQCIQRHPCQATLCEEVEVWDKTRLEKQVEARQEGSNAFVSS